MGALDDAREALDLWHAILLESRLEGAAACPWHSRVDRHLRNIGNRLKAGLQLAGSGSLLPAGDQAQRIKRRQTP
jgi:hypothetical protein